MKQIELKYEFSNEYFTSEAYKALRTNVQFCGTDVKVIAFTSSEAHEGKTTVCTELSKAFADDGKKILLIDADMRKSVMVSRYTEQTGIIGLSQLLSGMASIEDVKYTTKEGFDVIFAGKYPPNPVELLGSNAFREFLESQKSSYDYIFIDCPPLGMVIDGAVIASVCDSAVIVISIDVVKRKAVAAVKSQFEKSGCRILGVVLNHVAKKSERYYKKYYGKYQGYGVYAKSDKE
ncbi:MAG: CpsD/CapB family tyrosine-protein kinase [Clostridia bacterium]|nr:CpsD/CapB family tyrosine-protein kinase [Clostridia bacterium]